VYNSVSWSFLTSLQSFLVESRVLTPYHGNLCTQYIQFYPILILYMNFLSEKSPASECQRYLLETCTMLHFFLCSNNKTNLEQSISHCPIMMKQLQLMQSSHHYYTLQATFMVCPTTGISCWGRLGPLGWRSRSFLGLCCCPLEDVIAPL
jgi:hypothetical protein